MIVYIDPPRTASGSIRKALGLTDTPRHVPLWRRIRRLGDQFGRATTVMSIRNPYSRAVSLWKHQVHYHDWPFSKWVYERFVRCNWETNMAVRSWWEWLFMPQRHWLLGRNGEDHWADEIIRFENLEEDFASVVARLDLEASELEHSGQTQHRPYQEYYDETTRKRVLDYFASDFFYFNYPRAL